MNKYKKISQVLLWILIANLIVAFVKILLGIMLDINSLLADGFHAITDSLSNIIGLIGIKLASNPPNKDYPYGFQKFETIAGFIIGIMLLFIIGQIIYNAIFWFINPINPNITLPSMIALFVTILINIFVATFEYHQGKKYESDVLISDSFHTKSDIFISSGVLVTMILVSLGLPAFIDPIVSLIIAIFIFRSCLEIFKMTTAVLVDKKVMDEEKIIKMIKDIDEDIIDVHNIRSRGRMDHIYIDLHIITDPNKTVKEAHDLAHKIERILREKFNKKIELLAHIEPNER